MISQDAKDKYFSKLHCIGGGLQYNDDQLPFISLYHPTVSFTRDLNLRYEIK